PASCPSPTRRSSDLGPAVRLGDTRAQLRSEIGRDLHRGDALGRLPQEVPAGDVATPGAVAIRDRRALSAVPGRQSIRSRTTSSLRVPPTSNVRYPRSVNPPLA